MVNCIRKGWTLAVAALVALSAGTAYAQVTAGDQIDAAQTALGFEASTVMTAAIAEYGPLMLLGIGFLVAISLVWTVFRYFRRGAR